MASNGFEQFTAKRCIQRRVSDTVRSGVCRLARLRREPEVSELKGTVIGVDKRRGRLSVQIDDGRISVMAVTSGPMPTVGDRVRGDLVGIERGDIRNMSGERDFRATLQAAGADGAEVVDPFGSAKTLNLDADIASPAGSAFDALITPSPQTASVSASRCHQVGGADVDMRP